jgi:hypothetical protein
MARLRPKELAIEINGALYLTVANFALVTNRSQINARHLISVGNKVRKLKTMYLGGKPFVPFSELTEFPFTEAGRGQGVYHYDEEGRVVESEEAAR